MNPLFLLLSLSSSLKLSPPALKADIVSLRSWCVGVGCVMPFTPNSCLSWCGWNNQKMTEACEKGVFAADHEGCQGVGKLPFEVPIDNLVFAKLTKEMIKGIKERVTAAFAARMGIKIEQVADVKVTATGGVSLIQIFQGVQGILVKFIVAPVKDAVRPPEVLAQRASGLDTVALVADLIASVPDIDQATAAGKQIQVTAKNVKINEKTLVDVAAERFESWKTKSPALTGAGCDKEKIEVMDCNDKYTEEQATRVSFLELTTEPKNTGLCGPSAACNLLYADQATCEAGGTAAGCELPPGGVGTKCAAAGLDTSGKCTAVTEDNGAACVWKDRVPCSWALKVCKTFMTAETAAGHTCQVKNQLNTDAAGLVGGLGKSVGTCTSQDGLPDNALCKGIDDAWTTGPVVLLDQTACLQAGPAQGGSCGLPDGGVAGGDDCAGGGHNDQGLCENAEDGSAAPKKCKWTALTPCVFKADQRCDPINQLSCPAAVATTRTKCAAKCTFAGSTGNVCQLATDVPWAHATQAANAMNDCQAFTKGGECIEDTDDAFKDLAPNTKCTALGVGVAAEAARALVCKALSSASADEGHCDKSPDSAGDAAACTAAVGKTACKKAKDTADVTCVWHQTAKPCAYSFTQCADDHVFCGGKTREGAPWCAHNCAYNKADRTAEGRGKVRPCQKIAGLARVGDAEQTWAHACHGFSTEPTCVSQEGAPKNLACEGVLALTTNVACLAAGPAQGGSCGLPAGGVAGGDDCAGGGHNDQGTCENAEDGAKAKCKWTALTPCVWTEFTECADDGTEVDCSEPSALNGQTLTTLGQASMCSTSCKWDGNGLHDGECQKDADLVLSVTSLTARNAVSMCYKKDAGGQCKADETLCGPIADEKQPVCSTHCNIDSTGDKCQPLDDRDRGTRIARKPALKGVIQVCTGFTTKTPGTCSSGTDNGGNAACALVKLPTEGTCRAAGEGGACMGAGGCGAHNEVACPKNTDGVGDAPTPCVWQPLNPCVWKGASETNDRCNLETEYPCQAEKQARQCATKCTRGAGHDHAGKCQLTTAMALTPNKPHEHQECFDFNADAKAANPLDRTKWCAAGHTYCDLSVAQGEKECATLCKYGSWARSGPRGGKFCQLKDDLGRVGETGSPKEAATCTEFTTIANAKCAANAANPKCAEAADEDACTAAGVTKCTGLGTCEDHRNSVDCLRSNDGQGAVPKACAWDVPVACTWIPAVADKTLCTDATHLACPDSKLQHRQCAKSCKWDKTGDCQLLTDQKMEPNLPLEETECVPMVAGICPVGYVSCKDRGVVNQPEPKKKCGVMCKFGFTGPCQREVDQQHGLTGKPMVECKEYASGTEDCPTDYVECKDAKFQPPPLCASFCVAGTGKNDGKGVCQNIDGLRREGEEPTSLSACEGYADPEKELCADGFWKCSSPEQQKRCAETCAITTKGSCQELGRLGWNSDPIIKTINCFTKTVAKCTDKDGGTTCNAFTEKATCSANDKCIWSEAKCGAGKKDCGDEIPVQVPQCAELCQHGHKGPCQKINELTLTPFDPPSPLQCVAYKADSVDPATGLGECPEFYKACPDFKEQGPPQCAQFCQFGTAGKCQPLLGASHVGEAVKDFAACADFSAKIEPGVAGDHDKCADTEFQCDDAPVQKRQCSSLCAWNAVGQCQKTTDMVFQPKPPQKFAECVEYKEGTEDCPDGFEPCLDAKVQTKQCAEFCAFGSTGKCQPDADWLYEPDRKELSVCKPETSAGECEDGYKFCSTATTITATTTLVDADARQCAKLCAFGSGGPCQLKAELNRSVKPVAHCAQKNDGTCPAGYIECGVKPVQEDLQCAEKCAWGSPGTCQPNAKLIRAPAPRSETAVCVPYTDTAKQQCPSEHKKCPAVEQLQPALCKTENDDLKTCRAR